jgi:hypothetical protein
MCEIEDNKKDVKVIQKKVISIEVTAGITLILLFF